MTADGRGDADMVSRLEDTLERLLRAGARHVVVDVHRLTGDDSGILELLAATCHRIWSLGGSMEVVGLRDRLVFRPEVAAFPKLFGRLDGEGV